MDLGIETAELPVIGFLEASELVDVDDVSDQQSSESRFQAPISSISFRCFLICVFPLTSQKLLHGTVRVFNAWKKWRNKQPSAVNA